MRWIKWIALAVLLLALSLTAGWLAGVWYDNWQTLQEDCRKMEAELEASREEISRLQEQIFLLEQEAAEKETEKETEEEMTDPAGIPAGTVLAEGQAAKNTDAFFQIYEISDEIFARIYGKSYKEECTVPREELRYLKVLHYNFDHQVQVGELMVNQAIARDCLEIFRELYEQEYEIYSMYLVDDFQADDTLSCEMNNTSAFNFRKVTGGESLSNHAYGCAIDINPQQNPYVENGVYYHENAAPYIDRTGPGEHMIDHEDLCYRLFAEKGFAWGGDWENPIDYQHFEKDPQTVG